MGSSLELACHDWEEERSSLPEEDDLKEVVARDRRFRVSCMTVSTTKLQMIKASIAPELGDDRSEQLHYLEEIHCEPARAAAILISCKIISNGAPQRT